MPAQLEGFYGELAELEACPGIDVRVHITRISSTAVTPAFETPAIPKTALVIEGQDREIEDLKCIYPSEEPAESKTPTIRESSPLPVCAVSGRPDVLNIVGRVVGEASRRERILVAGKSHQSCLQTSTIS